MHLFWLATFPTHQTSFQAIQTYPGHGLHCPLPPFLDILGYKSGVNDISGAVLFGMKVQHISPIRAQTPPLSAKPQRLWLSVVHLKRIKHHPCS